MPAATSTAATIGWLAVRALRLLIRALLRLLVGALLLLRLLITALLTLLLRLLIAALGLLVAALALLVGLSATVVGWLGKHILKEASPAALSFLAYGLFGYLGLHLTTLRRVFGIAHAATAVVAIHLVLTGISIHWLPARGGLLHVAIPGLFGAFEAARPVKRFVGTGGLRGRCCRYGFATATFVDSACSWQRRGAGSRGY